MTLPTPDNLRADLVKALDAMAKSLTHGSNAGPVKDFGYGIRAAADALRIERPAQAEGARQKNGFQDKNGNWVYPGDRVVSTLDSWRGVLREALQDGDAEVMFDGGHPRQVKWNHLLKITDGCPRCGAKRAVGDACHVLGCPMAAPKPTDAPAPTQPIEAKADALIKQAQAVQLELLNLAARYDVGTRPRGTIINASDTLTELVVAIRAALAVQPAPDKPVDPGSLTDTATPGEIERIGHVIQLWAKSLRDDPAKFAGYIIRTLDHYRKTAAGPNIADLKPGHAIVRWNDGSIKHVQLHADYCFRNEANWCRERLKSWPATDGGTG